MTELETLKARIDQLEREIIFLRASVKADRKKEAVRVYVAEVTKRFGVSGTIVRRMQGEFAPLVKMKRESPTGRIYFPRKDYEKWLARLEERKEARRKLLTRTKRI